MRGYSHFSFQIPLQKYLCIRRHRPERNKSAEFLFTIQVLMVDFLAGDSGVPAVFLVD